jgi:hypothetical protein
MMRLAIALTCLVVLVVSPPVTAKDAGPNPTMQACQADFEKFCRDVKPGDGRQISCMAGNLDRLTEPCARIVREKSREMGGAREKKAKGQ